MGLPFMGGWVLLSDAPPATSPFPPLSPPLSTAATPFLRSPPLHAPEAEEDEAAAAAAAAACSHCATVVKAEMASSSFCASSSAEPDRVASLSGRGGGGGGRLTPVLGSPARAEALAACLRWRASFFGSRLRCGVWARFLTVGDGVGRREGCGRCECWAGREEEGARGRPEQVRGARSWRRRSCSSTWRRRTSQRARRRPSRPHAGRFAACCATASCRAC